MGRSKFNVSDSAVSRTYDGVVYDSAMEMKFYRDYVKPQMESGCITMCERQVTYELQEMFYRGTDRVNAITYVADYV